MGGLNTLLRQLAIMVNVYYLKSRWRLKPHSELVHNLKVGTHEGTSPCD